MIPNKGTGPRINKLSTKYRKDKIPRTKTAEKEVWEVEARGSEPSTRDSAPNLDPPVICLSSDSEDGEHDDEDGNDDDAAHPSVDESRYGSTQNEFQP